jgi:hypothetical protein
MPSWFFSKLSICLPVGRLLFFFFEGIAGDAQGLGVDVWDSLPKSTGKDRSAGDHRRCGPCSLEELLLRFWQGCRRDGPRM